uniref:Uncharacterized protein n=1 Tax=Glossina austeni TaxID=7395 RepID=A0A1A9VGJ0_GLOAU
MSYHSSSPAYENKLHNQPNFQSHPFHSRKIQLEVALRNGKDLNVLALVGPVGVGKNLVLSSLATNVPWPENVQCHCYTVTPLRDSKIVTKTRSSCELKLNALKTINTNTVESTYENSSLEK